MSNQANSRQAFTVAALICETCGRTVEENNGTFAHRTAWEDASGAVHEVYDTDADEDHLPNVR